jgi:hypothetical protein
MLLYNPSLFFLSQEEWEPLLGKLGDLEREVKGVRAYPSRIDETGIEDRMIALQRRIDEGVLIGRLTRVQGREFQWRLDDIRRDFFATDKRATLYRRGKRRYFQPP